MDERIEENVLRQTKYFRGLHTGISQGISQGVSQGIGQKKWSSICITKIIN